MKVITTHDQFALYSDLLVALNIVEFRMKLEISCIYLNYREIIESFIPLLKIDLFNEKGRLYTLRYNLPPDTTEHTKKRTSLLLNLVRKINNDINSLKNRLIVYRN